MIDYNGLTKLYYTIGEVAKMFEVNTSLVRYWETEFSMLKPSKNRKGDRRYTKKDIQLIEKIYDLVKKQGFTLEGAKTQIKNEKKGISITTAPNQDVINKLKSIKSRLQFIDSQIKA